MDGVCGWVGRGGWLTTVVGRARTCPMSNAVPSGTWKWQGWERCVEGCHVLVGTGPKSAPRVQQRVRLTPLARRRRSPPRPAKALIHSSVSFVCCRAASAIQHHKNSTPIRSGCSTFLPGAIPPCRAGGTSIQGIRKGVCSVNRLPSRQKGGQSAKAKRKVAPKAPRIGSRMQQMSLMEPNADGRCPLAPSLPQTKNRA